MQLIKSNSLILFAIFTKNNLFCTLTDLRGKVIISMSIGFFKIKGVKKITNISLHSLIKTLYVHAKKTKVLYLKIKGTNKIKNEFIKVLKVIGFNIFLIQEKLSLPYGGCKKVKSRKI